MRKFLLLALTIFALAMTATADEKDKKKDLKPVELSAQQQAAIQEASSELARTKALIDERARAEKAVADAAAFGLLNGIGVSQIGPNWRRTHKLEQREDGTFRFVPITAEPKPDKGAPAASAEKQPAGKEAQPPVKEDKPEQ